MPVTSVDKDLEQLTLTIAAEFPVPARRLWDAYADPRQLEKFWGPPEWPATFTRHDMTPGGRSDYYMTGPDGSRARGYWEYLAVDEGRSFEVLDGFSHDDGSPNTDLPTMRAVFTFGESAAGSRLETVTYFNNLAELEQLLEMGMEEGTVAAMGQIDAVVTDDTTFAPGSGTQAQFLDDRTVRVSRVLCGTPQQVWDAHHDPALLGRWFYGPDGWTLTACEVASAAGQAIRYEWAPAEGVEGEPFALTGRLVSTDPPHREVFTETMEGADAPPTHNEQTLTAVGTGP